MDALSEEFRRSEHTDTHMTMLTCEEMTELEEPAVSDEVEDLRNSLREAVHDEGVRPKMQCLMMDPCFSMVTVQGEDSGIEWETSAGRSATPWAPEPGPPPASEAAPMRPATPGSGLAGRIIFVMDEEQISRRKKARERVSSPKKIEVLPEDVDGVSGRPELVEVSLPNVKLEGNGGEQDEAAADLAGDKDQRLFRLVSEGSEILNIVVPSESNLASVDEEESTAMLDNLCYLEETPATKTNEEYADDVFEPFNAVFEPFTQARTSSRGSGTLSRGGVMSPSVMDPPGAPVSRPPPGRKAAGNVDYFEKFTLRDGQAPGSPTVVVPEGAEDPRSPEATESQGPEETDLLKDNNASQTAAAEEETSALLSGDELASDHLDDVFYGGTDAIPSPIDREDEGKRRPPRLSLKSSGSALFGSQENVLTPIFLPEGPAKIIDQILLEEPKAMAFMYTDLYEEAMGSRSMEEDTESLTSEKSFHSRHSDREARGYLEMYVLKDETPALEDEDAPTLETEAAAQDDSKEERIRMLSQDSYDFVESEISDTLHAEEEVTDFLRASDNSSPCDIEPFPQSRQDENDATSNAKSKAKRKKKASQTTEKPPQIPTNQPVENETVGQADYDEFYLDDDRTTDKVPAVDAFALEAPKPVATPRKKADSAPKTTLDLTPLKPVEVAEEGEVVGGKEQREEEKEMASPVETADEGDDGEDLKQRASSELPRAEDAPPALSAEAPGAAGSDPQTVEEKDGETMAVKVSDTETAKELTAHEVADITAVEAAQTRVEAAERPEETEAELSSGQSPPAAVTEAAKQTGRCVLL